MQGVPVQIKLVDEGKNRYFVNPLIKLDQTPEHIVNRVFEHRWVCGNILKPIERVYPGAQPRSNNEQSKHQNPETKQ